jgi:hypothetical protein
VNPSHREHDELLIVRAAGGETAAVDEPVAERQLAACEDCRALFADVQAIRASTVAEVLRLPPRPRSFRIPADDLDRLAVPLWRRWLGRLGKPRFDLLRPLATAVAGLGLVVMVLGSVSPAGAPAALEFAKGPSQSPAALAVPTAAPTGREGRQDTSVDQPGATSAPAAGPGAVGDSGAGPSAEPSGPTNDRTALPAGESSPAELPVTLAGAVLAIAGAILLAVHTAARRVSGR